MGIPTKVPIDLINPTPAASTDLNNKLNTNISTTGSGNAVTSISESNGNITVTKGSTFSTSSHTHSNYVDLTSTQTISGSKTISSDLNLQPSSASANTGGKINFHYNQASSATSSIYESLSGRIKLDGNVEINGYISGSNGRIDSNNIYNRCVNLGTGIKPTTGTIAQRWDSTIAFNNSYDNKTLSMIYTPMKYTNATDWQNSIYLLVYDITKENSFEMLGLGCNSTGWWTAAPTPAVTSNNGSIATTAFVNNRLSDIESKLAYIGVSTDLEGESTSGNTLGIVSKSIGSNEGGQIVLQRSSASYYNTIIDQYTNQFRIFQNGAANGRIFRINFEDNNTNIDCNGGKVEVAQEKSIGNSGYIRYYSGLQICWGVVNVPNDNTGHATVTFTKAFSSEPRIFSNVSYGGQYSTSVFCTQTGSRSTTGFDMFVNKIKDGAYSVDWGNICWLAIGNWK